MTCGGGWHAGRGIDEEISHQVRCGNYDEDTAARFVRAMMCGGLVEYEAYAVIRDRDCKGGVAHDVCDDGDIPASRWFRDAWRRSSNGGPIRIDEGEAKRIQWRKIVRAHDAETKRRHEDLHARELVVDLGLYRSRIKSASTLEDVFRVWPQEFERHV